MEQASMGCVFASQSAELLVRSPMRIGQEMLMIVALREALQFFLVKI
jgi:hypothetical protein